MSLTGSPAPQFRLPSTKNLDQLNVSVALEEHRGRWAVLIFYPGDFTFVCPSEMLAFSAAAEQFAAEQADLIAISTDGVHCHQAWQEFVLGPLAFPLASDSTTEVSRAYGVFDEALGESQRTLFIVDPEGVVRYEITHDRIVARSVPETLRVLQALRQETCILAGWVPDEPAVTAAAAA